MLTLWGKAFRNCDGISRRELLSVGTLVFGGATLGDQLRAEAQERNGSGSRPMAIIQVSMGGGPSHLDMYDLKPNAPAEIRGEFNEISTAVPGIRISEHLPLQAAVMDRLAILRSVTHGNSSHLPSSHFIYTGYNMANVPASNVNPSLGSVIAKARGANAAGMPAYVAVPKPVAFGRAAYLGGAYNPFTTDSEPNSSSFRVRNLTLSRGLSAARLQDRRTLLHAFDGLRRDIDSPGNMDAMDGYSQAALQMISGKKAIEAFDISRENPRVRDRYGRSAIGQNCLLARRLVEAGVTYVSCLSGGGWDTHFNNFRELKDVSLPRYDRAVAALVSDIYERGLADRVLVMAFGEFGRTPRINRYAGRDHWPGAMSVLLAGGALKAGQVVGATDSRGAFPISKPYSPLDVLATMYHVIGIDYHQSFYDHNNRPLPILPGGRPIVEVI